MGHPLFRGGSGSDGAAMAKPWNLHCFSRAKSKAVTYFPLRKRTPRFFTKLKASLEVHVLGEYSKLLLESRTSETSISRSEERDYWFGNGSPVLFLFLFLLSSVPQRAVVSRGTSQPRAH